MLLQKIVVVVVGLLMSVVGALTPEALFASNQGSTGSLAANTTEETLSTLRGSDGQAFARVSVLWVEVDGRRVAEDAWGTGEVDELRFKVGVKGVEDAALAVGEKVVNLHPTDIITIRMFRGDFSFRGVGTALATVQLQGTVKTTVLKEGDITNRVVTAPGELDLAGVRKGGTSPGDESKVAFVVLTTGEKVDTVAVEDGGARLFTQEATTASAATSEPGNLLAKWAKIDNKLVREYTWGDGVLKKVEFEPAEAATRSVVVEYNGDVAEVAAGERVVIEDFVGEYLIYQVSGGMMRVRLDGFAASFTTGSRLVTPTMGGAGAPVAEYKWSPLSPKTTDTVRFVDDSQDDGGIIVFREWDFGDDTSTVALERPTHRFEKPGAYDVKLTVTDNDLQKADVTHTIIVRNTEPVPDFDFSPKVVTTQTRIAFSDLSFDNDGKIESYEWDFGDGTTDSHRNPSKQYAAGGSYTVTLTATDDLGARASLSKVVVVRNAPPIASFNFSTANGTPPMTLEPIQFFDTSDDLDGDVVRWNWSFGDGNFGSGSAPTHAYARPGVYTVSLTVFDDKDDADTVSTNILIGNRPPFADFVWAPGDESPANVPITFTSTSVDPDGLVLLHEWDFGDGTRSVRGSSVSHTFPRAGVYEVKLVVTDNTLGMSNVTRSVSVSNSAPRANFAATPSPAFRGVDVVFSDASTDPDGDSIVNWTWEMGDGSVAFGKVVYYAYQSVGTKIVTLTVRDSEGTEATISRPMRVMNRPPTILADFSPRNPTAGDMVAFTAEGIDPDVPGGGVTFEWSFSDGVKATGAFVERSFDTARNYSVSVRGRDADGGVSQAVVLLVRVDHARPKVDFSFSPLIPVRNQEVVFVAAVVAAPDASIKEFRWDFGLDPSSTSGEASPTFVYSRNGTFNVTLEVVDSFNIINSTTKEIFINLAPSARFIAPQGGLQLGVPFTLTDASVDEDGTIESWRWEFGDGNTSDLQQPPDHVYTLPGAYQVNLTVTDDKGATSVDTKTLEVANGAPLARWTFTTGGLPQERGVPFSFDGSASSDPDGQPIVSHTWDFGDSSPTKNGAQVQHTFANSGFVTVGLVVGDGGKFSQRTADSHQRIRVGASHPVKLHVTGVLPGEREADLSTSAYTVTARFRNTALLPPEWLQVNGTGIDIVIPREEWLHVGYEVVVRITSPFLLDAAEATQDLSDGVEYIELPIQLRPRVLPTIIPYAGTKVGLLPPPIGADDRDYEGDPVYHDTTEKPRGTGRLMYADGSPAAFTPVSIEARWIPLRVVQPLRDAAQVSNATDGSIVGWCQVGTAQTLANGTFDWAFDGQSACVTNSLAGGLYPLGRWEVRAVQGTARDTASPARAFYYDPTGGVLITALGPTLA